MLQFATKRAAPLLLAFCLLVPGVAVGDADDNGLAIRSGEVHVGQGVVCDTADQVQRFSAVLDDTGAVDNAVDTVNEETHNPAACALVLAAFVPGQEVAQVRNKAGVLRVVEIIILAVPVGDEWQAVDPLKQYAAFPAKGLEI